MSSLTNEPPLVLELRVALTTQHFERLASFYRQGLGLNPSQVWPEDQGRSLVLDLGKATLEVFDERQATAVDQLEVGARVSGQIRFALQVPDLGAAMKRLKAHGAALVHGPIDTPWGTEPCDIKTLMECRSLSTRRLTRPDTNPSMFDERPDNSMEPAGHPDFQLWRDASAGLAGRLISSYSMRSK